MLSYRAIAQGIGPRVLVTPDPTQPEMFAIRGWRYGYSLSCLNETGAKHFAQAHYRQGPEDADADPPVETPSYNARAPSTSLPSRPRASPTPPCTSASTCTPASMSPPTRISHAMRVLPLPRASGLLARALGRASRRPRRLPREERRSERGLASRAG